MSEIIESQGNSDCIAGEERKLADLSWPWSPYNGFKVEDLRAGAVDCHTGTATEVAMLVLRVARHSAKIVDHSEAGVGASESREWREDTELSHVGQTLETGEVGAEVFVVGIFGGGFGLANDLMSEIKASGCTVGASESWCADVDWPALYQRIE